MSNHRWLTRVPSAGPASPATKTRANLDRGQASAGPVHPGGGFGFREDGGAGRDRARAELSPTVTSRLGELAGSVVDWWAEYNPQNRLEAAFFGDKGLALAMPGTGPENRLATEISCYVLVPGSLRSRAVNHRPQNWLRHNGKPLKPADAPTTGPIAQLSSTALGILGNLPAQAQQLMQAPFRPGNEILGCDWHYEGTPNSIEVFVMYLAGARDVTVATGSCELNGTDPEARWSLQVYRGQVQRRIGRTTWIRG